MHILAGLDRPTSGWVEIGGTRLDGSRDHELTLLRRSKVGFIFQSYNLLPVLTAEQNILLPVRIGGEKPDRPWLETLIDTVGLQDRRDAPPVELSGGQQQRVAVARALITRPAVVFADEPTGNLDSKASRDVMDLLRRAVDEFGQTIVMVTHDADAAAIADSVLFLADGCIVDRLRALAGRDPRPPEAARMIGLALSRLGSAQAALRAHRHRRPARRGDDRRHLRADRPIATADSPRARARASTRSSTWRSSPEGRYEPVQRGLASRSLSRQVSARSRRAQARERSGRPARSSSTASSGRSSGDGGSILRAPRAVQPARIRRRAACPRALARSR